MRFLALIILALAALGTAFVLLQSEGSRVPGTSAHEPLGVDTPAAEVDAPEPELEAPVEPMVSSDEGEADAAPDEGRVDAGNFTGMKLVDFHGQALVQPKGERPYSASQGTIEISILNRGQLVPMSIPIRGGQFSVELPERARIRVDGGRLEGRTVRFLGFKSLFTLDGAQSYAFIGEPVPLNLLRVFEGTQGVPLPSVTVRRSTDGHTARLEGAEPSGEAIMENAASPVELPFLDAKHPIWLHVSAEGYAPTALLVNPAESREFDVTLWPEASLIVRVTGKQRTRLKALLMHRMEPGKAGSQASKRHFATIKPGQPGVTTDTDATVFTIHGVPALPLRIEARGFDERGRETLMGTTSAEVGVGEVRTVELRIKDE